MTNNNLAKENAARGILVGLGLVPVGTIWTADTANLNYNQLVSLSTKQMQYVDSIVNATEDIYGRK